jgi:gliding motility-associated-like protein
MLSITGIDPGSTIDWQPTGQIIAGQNSPTITVSPPVTTNYTVEVVSPEGCTWSGSVTVSVSDINPNSVIATANPTAIQPGESSQLNVSPSTGVIYDWSPGTSLNDSTISNPIATPLVTTTYIVTVTDGICTRSDTVVVTVHELRCEEPDIFVPSGFSPNGDGTNDVLYVRGIHIEVLEFKIFDRWGEKVFETTNIDLGWDGYYKGKLVDPAVFVYYLDAKCVDGQSFFKKGNVSVLR